MNSIYNQLPYSYDGYINMHMTGQKRDYFWNTLGVFLQNAISPLLLVVVTRINGIYDSGLFSFAFAVSVIFWVVGMWGGRTYQVSDVRQEFSPRSYIMARLILAACMIIGAVAFAAVNQYDADKTLIILALVVFKAIESVADSLYGVLQVHDRLHIAGKSLTYKAISGFVLFAAIDFLTHNIFLACLGIIAANIFFVMLYDLRVAGKFDEIRIGRRHISDAAKSAATILRRTWPVSTVVFLSLFALNIPRYFVDVYHQDQIGYFGILAMPITLIGLVMTFVLQPKVVYLSKLHETGNYLEFSKIVGALALITVMIGAGILMGAYVMGVPALELIFGTGFSEHKLALMIIIAGGVVNALVTIFINLFIIIRHFKAQFFILLATNLALVVSSALFVRGHGLQGAVSLFTLVNLVQLALLFAAYKVILRPKMYPGD